jgi:hypothetical protein
MENALVCRTTASIGFVAIMLVTGAAIGNASGQMAGVPVDYTKELIGVEAMRVTFYEDIGRGKLLAEVKVSIRSEIDQFIGDFKGKTAPCYKCGYDGQIEFINKNLTAARMDFNLQCRQVSSDKGCWNMDDECIKRLENLRSTALKSR